MSLPTSTTAWLNSMDHVMTHGTTSYPRQIETKEILNSPCEFDMNYPVVNHPGRNLHYGFMAAEAYWITSGSPLVEDIAPYNKHISKFSDDGYIFNGAYGPAFLSQVNYVVATLLNDKWSRQAIMTIWHPNPIDSKDHKCTVALAFNIRDDKIHTTVFMRSNDLWLGRPYDMFNFTMMTLRILCQYNSNHTGPNVGLGDMCIHAVSSHIYATNYEEITDVLQVQEEEDHNIVPTLGHKDWQFLVDSMLTCRDNKPHDINLWRIRP